jgi:hypothetical protein
LLIFSANFFINFHWLNFQTHFRKAFGDLRFAQRHTASHKDLLLEKFKRSGWQRLKRMN